MRVARKESNGPKDETQAVDEYDFDSIKPTSSKNKKEIIVAKKVIENPLGE